MHTTLHSAQVGAPGARAPIEKMESPEGDFYMGTADQLIAAGLIRADQLPPPERAVVTFLNGQERRGKGNYRKDENLLRVQRWCGKSTGLYRVHVGVPVAVMRQRAAVEQAKYDTARKDIARTGQALDAEAARERLEWVPRTADAFRRDLVRELRMGMRLSLDYGPRARKHGYALTPESLEKVLVSVDAVVEAVMQSDVLLDHAVHLALVNSLQAQIAAGAGELSAKVQQLTAPNFALLCDEVQP